MKRITVAALAGPLAVLLTACGSSAASPAGSPSGSPPAAAAVSYAHCMRSHAVPDYPDPGSDGALPKGSAQQFGVSGPVLQAAETACAPLLPGPESFQQQVSQCEATGDCPAALVQHALDVMRPYARCMRAHGIPNFPDPAVDAEGRPYFDVSGAGLSRQFTRSAQFAAADAACERQAGGSADVPVALG